MENKTLFEGSSFIVKDISLIIDGIRGVNYPFGSFGEHPEIIKSRPLNKVEYLIDHQTYGNVTAEGIDGPVNTAKFLTGTPIMKCSTCQYIWSPKKGQNFTCPSNHPRSDSVQIAGGRGYAFMSYGLWIPFNPLMENGKWLIYQNFTPKIRTWHSGAGNKWGFARVFQGSFVSRLLGKTFRKIPGTDGHPSKPQREMSIPVFTEYVRGNLLGDNLVLRTHADFGKPTCPGDDLENIVREYNCLPIIKLSTSKKIGDPTFAKLGDWFKRQQALVDLGYPLGGDFTNPGIDGIPGDKTKYAIELFQLDHGLNPDGVWGPLTDAAVLTTLRKSGRHKSF